MLDSGLCLLLNSELDQSKDLSLSLSSSGDLCLFVGSLLDRWIEFSGSSSVSQQALVDSLQRDVSGPGDVLDPVSVVLVALVVIRMVL